MATHTDPHCASAASTSLDWGSTSSWELVDGSNEHAFQTASAEETKAKTKEPELGMKNEEANSTTSTVPQHPNTKSIKIVSKDQAQINGNKSRENSPPIATCNEEAITNTILEIFGPARIMIETTLEKFSDKALKEAQATSALSLRLKYFTAH